MGGHDHHGGGGVVHVKGVLVLRPHENDQVADAQFVAQLLQACHFLIHMLWVVGGVTADDADAETLLPVGIVAGDQGHGAQESINAFQGLDAAHEKHHLVVRRQV